MAEISDTGRPIVANAAAPSPLASALGFASENPVAAFAGFVLALVVFAAIGAPLIAPQNPYDLGSLDLLDALLPPLSPGSKGATYLLGTDDQGRDMLSAILFGLRTSLLVAVLSALAAMVIGITIGLTAAFYGGRVDAFMMRVVDVQLSFPAVLIALVLVALLGRGVDKTIIALIAVQWAYYARTIRGAALAERGKEYIEAAESLGLGRGIIVFQHLLPNCLSAVTVVGTVQLGHAVALEATLSFLGLGVPVTRPSLGLLIANGFEYLLSGRYWVSLYPGFALVLVIVAVNVLSDRLREINDPRNRR